MLNLRMVDHSYMDENVKNFREPMVDLLLTSSIFVPSQMEEHASRLS